MKDLKNWINLHDLSSPGPTGSLNPVLSLQESHAVEETAFNDVETCEAVAEFLKELALYGRTDGMDRQLADRLHGLLEKNMRFSEEDGDEDEHAAGGIGA